MSKKIKKIRLRMVCDLCRPLEKRTDQCQHAAFRFFPETMRVSELPADLELEINPKRSGSRKSLTKKEKIEAIAEAMEDAQD